MPARRPVIHREKSVAFPAYTQFGSEIMGRIAKINVEKNVIPADTKCLFVSEDMYLFYLIHRNYGLLIHSLVVGPNRLPIYACSEISVIVGY